MRTTPSRLVLQLLLPAAVATFAAACAPAASQSGGGTSNAAIITAEDLERYPGEPIERILERKVPGLQAVRTSSGGIAFRIRGAASWDGSERPPLYILNGTPIAAGPEGALPNISIEDIETIKVLRGPDAAIYGIDGANGVIVISTRKGPRR
jgi:TonB-dependent starch-binding outer membrane protein SusC